MAQSDQDRRVDYVEFGATDVSRTREFYEKVFGNFMRRSSAGGSRITDRTTRASRMVV